MHRACSGMVAPPLSDHAARTAVRLEVSKMVIILLLSPCAQRHSSSLPCPFCSPCHCWSHHCQCPHCVRGKGSSFPTPAELCGGWAWPRTVPVGRFPTPHTFSRAWRTSRGKLPVDCFCYCPKLSPASMQSSWSRIGPLLTLRIAQTAGTLATASERGGHASEHRREGSEGGNFYLLQD